MQRAISVLVLLFPLFFSFTNVAVSTPLPPKISVEDGAGVLVGAVPPAARPSRWPEARGLDEVLKSFQDELASRPPKAVGHVPYAPQARVQDLIGANFPIANPPNPVGEAYSLDQASLAYNPSAGEYLAVWVGARLLTGADIYARRLNASGGAVGDAFLVCGAETDQSTPHVSYDANAGQYWVVWQDWRAAVGWQVRFRRVSAAGALLGSEVVANAGTRSASEPRVVSGGGRTAIIWTETDGSSVYEVIARVFGPTGTALGSPMRLSPAGVVALAPDVAHNPDADEYMMVWTQHNGATDFDVVGRRLAGTITTGTAILTMSNAGDAQVLPRVAYNTQAQRYLVVWQDRRDVTDWDIYGQLLSPTGALVGGNLGVYRGVYDDTEPSVASRDTASEFLVVYTRAYQPSGHPDICAQIMGGDGTRGEGFRIWVTTNDRWAPALAHRSGTNEFLVVWTDRYYRNERDIYGYRVLTTPALMGSRLVISAGRKGEEHPSVAYNNQSNEYLAVWQDFRSGTDYNIRGRRVGPTGQLLGSEISVSTAGRLKGRPDVAYNPTLNEYLIVWEVIYPEEDGYQVYGQRLGPTGSLVGSAMRISHSVVSTMQGSPRAVYNASLGHYMVTWYAFSGTSWKVYGQRVSGAGEVLGGNVFFNKSAADCTNPKIALKTPANEYLLVWTDEGDNRLWAVRGDRFGGPLFGVSPWAVSPAGTRAGYDLTYDSANNRFLLIWAQTAPTAVLQVQLLDTSGNPQGAPKTVATGACHEPALSYDPQTGGYLAVWMSHNNNDLYGRRLSATGDPVGAAFVLSSAPDIQWRPALTRTSQNGGFLVVWQDYRNQSWDIYGQLWTAQAVSPTSTATATATATRTATVTQTVSPGVTPTVTRTPAHRCFLPIIIRNAS